MVEQTNRDVETTPRRYTAARTQADALKSTLQFERVYQLFSDLPTAIGISVLLALIMIYVQWTTIGTNLLLGWLTVILLVLLSRAMLYVAWRKATATNAKFHADTWLQRFRIGTGLAGIVWGVAGVLLVPSGDVGHILYVTFALAGLSAGGATTLAIDRVSVNIFLLSVLTPQIVFLAQEDNTIAHGMSAMMVLFLLFLLGSAWKLRLRLEENIHLRNMATENELRMSQILEGSPIATRIVDAENNKVVFANKSYISLIESTPEQVIGISPTNYYAHPEEYADAIAQLRKGIYVTNKLVELHDPEGFWTKWALASFFAVEYQGKPAILGWFYDITERKLMEDRVEHMAYHDTLTDLPNRYLFIDRLQQAIVNAERDKSTLALMFMDLDKFKDVNDRHGPNVGDLLLVAVAERILGCLRKSDSAARLGGDEFVILLSAIKTEENALRIAENIRREISRPFDLEELHLHISMSIGVALYPDHANTQKQLMKCADAAMYYAKEEGRNRVKTYSPEM
ncbi:MAG: sensor domain-containing diguanylate cyclase [Candidatus Thiodiazotropha sp.]